MTKRAPLRRIEATPAQHKQAWKRLAPLGLIAVGLGASVIGEATLAKGRGDSVGRWVPLGTLGLACLNAGLCLFGDAVKHRALYEWNAQQQRDAGSTTNPESPGLP